MPSATMLPITDVSACCTNVTRETISAENAELLARSLKALADPVRLRLISIVAASEGDEACVCDLTEPLGLSQPTVSHHLKQLVEVGLVRAEKRGRWTYYELVPAAFRALCAALAPFTQTPVPTEVAA